MNIIDTIYIHFRKKASIIKNYACPGTHIAQYKFVYLLIYCKCARRRKLIVSTIDSHYSKKKKKFPKNENVTNRKLSVICNFWDNNRRKTTSDRAWKNASIDAIGRQPGYVGWVRQEGGTEFGPRNAYFRQMFLPK